jgi:hypothetical protein
LDLQLNALVVAKRLRHAVWGVVIVIRGAEVKTALLHNRDRRRVSALATAAVFVFVAGLSNFAQESSGAASGSATVNVALKVVHAPIFTRPCVHRASSATGVHSGRGSANVSKAGHGRRMTAYERAAINDTVAVVATEIT